ncbi:MAG: helix-turn-helix domain-containing protein [Promethearchaeota archaeon]
MSKAVFPNLLSEISNSHRIKILSLLDENDITLTKITERLGDISRPEVSRHLTRLTRHGFIRKEIPVGRKYEITPFGKIAIDVVKPLKFLFKHYAYFKKHRVNDLPNFLTRQLDALENSESIQNIGKLMNKVNNYFQIPSEEMWFMSEVLFPFERLPYRKVYAICTKKAYYILKDYRKIHIDVEFQVRILKSLPIALMFNDVKGFIAFPRLDEIKTDYSVVFQVNDEKGIKFLRKVWDYFNKMGMDIF